MSYFKSDEANRLFDIWVNNSPQSFHDLDMDRFADLVVCLIENDEDFDRADLKEQFDGFDYERIGYYYKVSYKAMKSMYAKFH